MDSGVQLLNVSCSDLVQLLVAAGTRAISASSSVDLIAVGCSSSTAQQLPQKPEGIASSVSAARGVHYKDGGVLGEGAASFSPRARGLGRSQNRI